jgi:thiol:disulfide interchange protein
MQRFRINLLFSILILVWLGGQTSAQEIHYYTILGCHDCEEIQEEVLEPLVRDFQEGGTDLQLVIHDILNAQEFEDMQSEMSRLGLRYEGTPFVIIADQYFIGNDLNAQKLSQNLRMLGEGQTSGEVSPQATEGQTSNPESPSSTKGTDHDFSLIAVLAAGLIDGINPCALMTLLFLISLLAVGGQSKRIIFLVGLGFTLGVFGTYLAIGIGLLRTADALGWPSWLGDSLKYAMSGVLLLFVFLSLRDFFKLRAGKSEEVALAMPEGLKKLSKKLMRKSRLAGFGFLGALVLGVLLSLLEFVCTGQVYLPTLMYLYQADPGGYFGPLLAYNASFILPLVLVFVLLLAGVGQRAIVDWTQKHLPLTKLLLAGLFLALAVLIFVI